MECTLRKIYPITSSLSGWLQKATKTFFKSIQFVVWKSTHDPIENLLNEQDPVKQDNLTTVWRDCKVSELATVGYTSALVASVIASAFSWFPISSSPWTVRAVWYSSLTLAMSSISVSTQQTVTLHRIGSHSEALQKIRSMLGEQLRGAPVKPRPSQLYVWQIPVMLLTVSILLFLIGLAILIFHAAFAHSSTVWTDDKKIVVVFTIAGTYAAVNYVSSLVCLYSQASKL
ncbi:hypothetical protein N431DRAFT_472808 [Stipitochalara longipes BDJ]|nr:hypothetical protein N431DRAFT_472808 [Stipitochalara longipes BDJ]